MGRKEPLGVFLDSALRPLILAPQPVLLSPASTQWGPTRSSSGWGAVFTAALPLWTKPGLGAAALSPQHTARLCRPQGWGIHQAPGTQA